MNTDIFSRLALREYPRILIRHQRKVIGVFLGTIALILLGLVFCSRTYESEAKVFVRVGRESVTLDPTANTGQVMSVSETRESEINSILEVIQSRSLMGKVVDTMSADYILGYKSQPKADVDTVQEIAQAEPAGSQDSKRREKAIRFLERKIGISAARKSSVLTIRCTAKTPKLAQDIVANLLEVFLEEHMRVYRTPGSFEFFTEQSQMLEKQLKEATQNLRDAKNEIGLVSIEGHRKIIQDQLATIETEIHRSQASKVASEARIRELENSIRLLPERVKTLEVSGIANEAKDNMQGQLYLLQIRERELLSKYTEKHPFVVAIRQQVKDAQKILSGQSSQRAQATTAVNPAREALQLDHLKEKTNAASLTAQVKTLEEQYAREQQELKNLNTAEIEIAQLQRTVDLLDNNFRTHSENLEQARVDQALKSEQITNINTVQPASYVSKPIGPKKRLIFVLGLFVAACSALGVALVGELLDHSLKTPEEAEKVLGLEVLTAVPQVASHQTILN